MSGTPEPARDRATGGANAAAPRAALVLAACLLLAPCASLRGGGGSELAEHLRAGRRAAAVELFRSDSALQRREAPLYRMAVLHATPADSLYDPARADTLLGRLLELHPETRFRREAVAFRALVDSAAARGTRLEALERKVEALKALDTGAYPDTGSVR